MLISAAVLSNLGDVFISDFIPADVAKEIRNQADAFLFSIKREDNSLELPYIETTHSRFIFRETGDLYWLMVTKTDSDLDSDIDLLGKFVCTIMEYGSPELNSATLSDEQKNLFYRHIWRAWDENPQCPLCERYNSQANIWQRDLAARVRFLASIRDGQVNEKDVLYFNRLIDESWYICAKLSSDHSDESVCSNDTISEEAVVDGCRLACLLEDIRLELKRIQDPYMRLFARRDLLKSSILLQDNDYYNNINSNNSSIDDSFDNSSISH